MADDAKVGPTEHLIGGVEFPQVNRVIRRKQAQCPACIDQPPQPMRPDDPNGLRPSIQHERAEQPE